MKKEHDVKNIYQRIVDVMKQVKYIQKSDKKVNNLYSFVTHDSVAAALHMPLAENGIVMIPSILELEQDGNRTKIKMEIVFVNADNPQEKITVMQYGYGIDPQDKGIGKAQSYAVKYALLKLFCLETGEDIEKDNINYEPAKPVIDPEIIKKAVNERKNEIVDIVGKENLDLLKKYVEKLKTTFKSKKEEELILGKTADSFSKDFLSWKEKQNEKAA